MLEYRGKLVLAPMVRVSELPTRLLALKYGADLVWGPEIIDKKILQCKRVWNEKLKCVDFVEDTNEKLVFRTCPELERSRLVFQMGTASPDLAVKAAKIIASDVDAIDVNSGCPKHFSIHSGMGAALLRTPDLLISILTSLVQQVGKPFGIPISVKIRLLEDPEATYGLVRRLVKTGIRCLTIHCRTTPMRPREPSIRDALAGIADICREADVACLVNGDIGGRFDLERMIQKYRVDGAMIARGAEANASCFAANSPAALMPWQNVAQEYMSLCRQFENHYSNAKYCVLKMIPGKSKSYQAVTRAKSLKEIEEGLLDDVNETPTATIRPAKRPLEGSIDSERKRQIAVA
jgi:tRNA-dihydrouridine synthase 2